MLDKSPNLIDVLNKVWKTQVDSDLQELLGGVMLAIGSKPEMEIGISKSDSESIVFTSPQGRPTVTTLGRLMTRHLGYDPKKYSLAIQVLTDAYLAEVRRANVSFDIVNGADIVEAYNVEWGAHSCMTGSESKYTKFVQENKAIISMLLFKDKTTKARAFLWNTVQGDRVLDRIYPNSGWHVGVIKNWAHKLGIVQRVSDSLPSGSHIRLSNGKQYTVSVKNKKNVWAYMDTFTFGICEDEEKSMFLLSNSHTLINSQFHLQTTSGRLRNWNACHHCKDFLGPGMNSYDIYLDRKDEYPKLWCEKCMLNFSFRCAECGRQIVRKDGTDTLCNYCKAYRKKRDEEQDPPETISTTYNSAYATSTAF